jgi:hypothetical protein
MSVRDVHATRWSHFRNRLRGRWVVYGLLFGVALGIAGAALWHRPLLLPVIAAVVAVVVLLYQWTRSEGEAADDFFRAFAPTAGLEYVVSGTLPPITPLLSAGEVQLCKHVMEGPLFGALGGPACTLAHYEFQVSHADGENGARKVPHDFTVCALEVPGALPVFHGVYLRRRPQIRIPGLWDDWLARAHAHEVDLESADFEALYELRAARDQDQGALYELFSPSFILWLAGHPLRPGFECKAGTLVVFIPGHEGDADRLTLFHEASREVARRVSAAVEASQAVSPAV